MAFSNDGCASGMHRNSHPGGIDGEEGTTVFPREHTQREVHGLSKTCVRGRVVSNSLTRTVAAPACDFASASGRKSPHSLRGRFANDDVRSPRSQAFPLFNSKVAGTCVLGLLQNEANFTAPRSQAQTGDVNKSRRHELGLTAHAATFFRHVVIRAHLKSRRMCVNCGACDAYSS